MPPSERAQYGMIFWVDLPEDESEGTEQRKRRPCVIVSSNRINSDAGIKGYTIVPLSKKIAKRSTPFRVVVSFREEEEAGLRLALVEQLRFISENRLIKGPIDSLSNEDLMLIELGIKYVLGLR